jgi:hypothetical protein
MRGESKKGNASWAWAARKKREREKEKESGLGPIRKRGRKRIAFKCLWLSNFYG